VEQREEARRGGVRAFGFDDVVGEARAHQAVDATRSPPTLRQRATRSLIALFVDRGLTGVAHDLDVLRARRTHARVLCSASASPRPAAIERVAYRW